MDRKILVIEDDFALAMGLNYTLKADGYLTDHAKNLKEAREFLLKEKNYSLIILDVMLPDGDGFSFLEEFMQMNIDIPVIFSTDEANIVRGLDLGADDYITKPYRVKELLARIAAVIRRHERGRNNTKASEDFIYFGEHKFSESSLRLYIGDELIDCTPAELRLLREFLNNKGIVLTRNLLMERLYDTENSFIDDNTLSVYIKRLRDKLGEDAGFIKTVKGVGYRFGE